MEAIPKAQGYTTYRSPEGADGGADILAGAGHLGWTQKELLEQLFAHYDHLDEDLKAELPLKRVWMVAAQEGE